MTSCKILWIILKLTREELKQNGPKNKEIDDWVQGLHPRNDIERLCQEKIEVKNSFALRITVYAQFKEIVNA